MADAIQSTVLDIDAQKVAGVYAQAFVGAAQAAGKVDALVAELESLVANVLDANPQFESLLGSALIKHEEKVGILDRVLGAQASPELLNFLKVCAAHERLDALRAIQVKVRDLYNVLQGRVDVLLTTPIDLDEEVKAAIVAKLHSMLGAEPQLTLATDASLLGGVVVRVADTVYDGSVATRLSRLRTQMIDRTVEQIETNRERFS
jgi:F-type H+-transporting ATPase subunit delta